MEFNRQTIITFPENEDIPDITTGIVSGSLNLEEILCSKNIEFGEFNATKFEAQVYQLSDVSHKKIVVYQIENNSKIAIFTGIIDSCKKDKSGYYRDIVAYDDAYNKKDINVAQWWTDYWKANSTTTLKDFRLSLLNYIGIKEEDKDLFNDDLIFTKPADLDSMPFGTLISAICQLQLCFPHINRLGNIEYITLSEDKSKAINVAGFEGDNSTFETYRTANITRVQIYDGNDLTGIAGLEGNNYNIKDNIILTALDRDSVQELAENILDKLNTISLTPCEVKMLYSHLDYNLGDYIYVNGVYSYIMSNTLSGVRLVEQTIKASADEYFSQTTDYSSNIQYTKDKTDRILKVLEAEYIKVDVADLKYATIESLKVTNAEIDRLNTNKLNATYADIINANVESLRAANAEITQLKANSLTADIANLKYAQIDFANVKEQVVTTSLIKDGAVTNEKVGNLSADKITSGEIDASKITVTNLNADNITVGTINGKRIGTGSLSLDKLAEEVPTKEYLDRVQEGLQGQIDGNIETFTKTEIPTLNNKPAVNWIDDATRKKHIGDICYVVNPASSADGYSYRFADTGTLEAPNYEWVLIKDSDVTKALQDIININGEITGIKKFDVEISSWKTDTDSELSSLKTRTTSLETDMGNKVDTKTFNEVKQTVDENSSTITQLSEVVGKKADGSTVETLSNAVNSIKQTTNSNSLSISNLTKVVEEKANMDVVEGISNKLSTVEQNLNGLTINVTNQYKYIDNQLNGNHTIYDVTYVPTKDNFPANEWNIPLYPNDDFFPSDETWEYTDEEYENYVGTIAYWKEQKRAWRFIRNQDGSHDWIEISATETAYLLNQNAELELNVNTISTNLSSLTTNIEDNYSTTVEMTNAITQAVSDGNNSIRLEISGTYVTQDALSESLDDIDDNIGSVQEEFNNYTKTVFLDNYIKQLVDDETTSTSIALRGEYTTKDALGETLNGYATTASLDLYIKKDPKSGELKSAIEAIADDISLSANGSINISGNKSVNISGDLFTLTTTNTTIAADGTITCNNLISSNAKITGGSIDITTDSKDRSVISLNYQGFSSTYSPYGIGFQDGRFHGVVESNMIYIMDTLDDNRTNYMDHRGFWIGYAGKMFRKDNTLEVQANGALILSNGYGYELILQGDGNLVLYHNGDPIWSTGTSQESN